MIGADSRGSESTLETDVEKPGNTKDQSLMRRGSTSSSVDKERTKRLCHISRRAVGNVLASLWYQVLIMVVIILDCIIGVVVIILTAADPLAMWYGFSVVVIIDISVILDVWVSGREFFYVKVAQPDGCCGGRCFFKHWRPTNIANLLISAFATVLTIQMVVNVMNKQKMDLRNQTDEEAEVNYYSILLGRITLLFFRLIVAFIMFCKRIETLVVAGGEKKGKQVLGRLLGDLFKVKQSNILIDPLMGTVKLEKLEFNVEEWGKLHLPFVIKAGFLDSIDVKLPVKSLLQDKLPFIGRTSQVSADSPVVTPRATLRMRCKRVSTASFASAPASTTRPQTAVTLTAPVTAHGADARKGDDKKRASDQKKMARAAANVQSVRSAQQKADRMKVHVKNVLIVIAPRDSTWQWHDVLMSRNKVIEDLVKWAKITGLLRKFAPASTRASIMPHTFVEKQKALLKKVLIGTFLQNLDVRFESFEFIIEATPPFVYKPVCFGFGFDLFTARVGERVECSTCISNDLLRVNVDDTQFADDHSPHVGANSNVKATLDGGSSYSAGRETMGAGSESLDSEAARAMFRGARRAQAMDVSDFSPTPTPHSRQVRDKLGQLPMKGKRNRKTCLDIELSDMMVYGDFTFTSYVTMSPNAARKYFTDWWRKSRRLLMIPPDTSVEVTREVLAAKLQAHNFILSPVNISMHMPSQGDKRKGTLHIDGYTDNDLEVTLKRDQLIALRSVKAWHEKWALLNLNFLTRPHPLNGTESQMEVSLHFRKMWWHAVRLIQLRTRPNNRAYSAWMEMSVVAGLIKQYREVREHEETLLFHRQPNSVEFSDLVAETRLRLPVTYLLFYEAMIRQNTAKYINEYRSAAKKSRANVGLSEVASAVMFLDADDRKASGTSTNQMDQESDEKIEIDTQDSMSKTSAVNALISGASVVLGQEVTYQFQPKELQLSPVNILLSCIDASHRTVACMKCTIEGEFVARSAQETSIGLMLSRIALESAGVTKLYMGEVETINSNVDTDVDGDPSGEAAARYTVSSLESNGLLPWTDRWWDGSLKDPNVDDDKFTCAESRTKSIIIEISRIVGPKKVGDDLVTTLTVDVRFGKMEIVIDDWMDQLKGLFKPAAGRKLALFEQEIPVTQKHKARPRAFEKTQRLVGKFLQVTKTADRAFVTIKFDVIRYVKHQPYSTYRTLIQQAVLVPFMVNIRREFGRSLVMKSTYQEASAHITIVDTKVMDAIFKNAELNSSLTDRNWARGSNGGIRGRHLPHARLSCQPVQFNTPKKQSSTERLPVPPSTPAEHFVP